MRDMLIVASISAEALSLTKALSFPFVVVLGILQNKFFLKRNLKRVLISVIIFFLSFQILFFGKLLPTFHLSQAMHQNYPHCKILFSLLEKLPNCLFYIFSEMFGVAISVNFWTLANRYNNISANQYFILAQCGLFLAGSIAYFETSWLNNFSLFLIPFVIIIFSLFLFKEHQNEKIKEQNIYEEKSILANSKFYFWLLPVIALLVSISSGLFDAFFKAQLKSHYSDKLVFIKKISQSWILQAVLSVILGLFLRKNRFSNIISPITTILFTITIIICLVNGCDVLSLTMFAVVLTKSIKYSTHSPTKETFFRMLPFGEKVKPYEGIAGKFGKQIIAFSTAILFSFGYDWVSLRIPILGVITLCTIIWLILSFFMKINYSNKK